MSKSLGGFKRGCEHIYITHIPQRKEPCLCIGNDNVIQPIAYFISEEFAEGFYEMLQEWFELKQEDV